MPDRPLNDRLDEALQGMWGAEVPQVEADLVPLLAIARELRELPRESFKAHLKSDLERKTTMATMSETVVPTRQTAAPRLRARNAAAAIEFYKKAFGAEELLRFEVGGEVAHAELRIGNATVMLGEEALDYGFPSPDTLGGSPLTMHLWSDDVDRAVERAVAAGGKLVMPVSDQFYGDRTGQVLDPFGYTWAIATRIKEMSLDEMHRNFAEMQQGSKPDPARPGFRTVTPYPVARNGVGLVDFVKKVFDAEEKFRAIGSAGGIHCEVLLGDSMMMIGGGGPGLSFKGDDQPMAFHVYVRDTDATYQRALDAGAVSLQAPADQPWGERTANVRDPHGNHWYIATFKGENYFSEGAPTVQPYLHPLRAEPLIQFLKRAFGAKEMGRYTTPEGVVPHVTIKIGNSALEIGEADGPYQPMPSMFYLYVPDVDAVYRKALNAGAVSTSEPANQSYGDRTAAVKDIFGNQWYLATPIGEGKG